MSNRNQELGSIDPATLKLDWKLNIGNLITLACVFCSIIMGYSQITHRQETMEKSLIALTETLTTASKRNDLLYDEIRSVSTRLAVLQTQFDDRRFPGAYPAFPPNVK